MTEKRVSVRLAAVGGRQVRAELEGVGDAGVKAFGRMSKEAELANARLAAFAIHWQQRMRGALSRLPTASGPWIWRPADGAEGPAQMNLFEGMLP